MKTECGKIHRSFHERKNFTFSHEDGKRRPLRRAIGRKYRQVSFRDVRRSITLEHSVMTLPLQ